MGEFWLAAMHGEFPYQLPRVTPYCFAMVEDEPGPGGSGAPPPLERSLKPPREFAASSARSLLLGFCWCGSPSPHAANLSLRVMLMVERHSLFCGWRG
jgi:hypothetical protein